MNNNKNNQNKNNNKNNNDKKLTQFLLLGLILGLGYFLFFHKKKDLNLIEDTVKKTVPVKSNMKGGGGSNGKNVEKMLQKLNSLKHINKLIKI